MSQDSAGHPRMADPAPRRRHLEIEDGTRAGVGERLLRGMYRVGKALTGRTPRKNLFAPVETNLFQTKQLVFTRRFRLSLAATLLALAAAWCAVCREAQHGAPDLSVSRGLPACCHCMHWARGAPGSPWPFKCAAANFRHGGHSG